MTQIDAEALLKQWRKEYPFPGDLIWGGYIELGGSPSDGFRFGQCNYQKYMSPTTHQWTPRSTVYLDTGMAKAPRFFQESVLWHELAHARAYNEDMINNDHDSVWASYRKQKPKYWIGDIVFKLIGWIWCR